MRQRFLLFLLLFSPLLAEAGQLKGRVTDARGEGLPFASVYIRHTTSGSTTNEDGFYQLTLAPGTYEIVFQYVGYKPRYERVAIGEETLELHVTLEPETYNLGEVTVRAGGKDPAYAIMREAINRRRYHLTEVNAFSARVYLKGLQRLTEAPKRVMGIYKVPPSLKPGIVYLSESVSEFHFRRPNKVREQMISSKVSGNSRAFSWNMASDFNFNFYNNLLKAEGLSERGYVSPVAANAFLYYRYQLVGATVQQGQTVNKIRVTPIRRTDPAFSGHIYILDDSWRIHSLDLMLTKEQQVEFVDTIRINQVFAPVRDGIWMLQSQKIDFKLEGFGFKGNGYYTVVYSNYRIQPAHAPPPQPAPFVAAAPVEEAPTPAQATPASKTPAPILNKPLQERRARQQEAGMMPESAFRKGEILVVDEGANTRDSAYWETVRPVPLTVEEVRDYHEKDSLQVIKESKPYKDSLDVERNRLSVGNLLLTGYRHSNTFRRRYLNFDPLFRIWQYNTVEGAVANLRVTYAKHYENRRLHYQVTPTLRYGFSNRLFSAKLAGAYHYDHQKQGMVALEGGRFVQQINEQEPITPFINSFYTLFNEQNFLKLYRKDYVRLTHRREIVNGLTFSGWLEYADRHPLANTTGFTFRDRPERVFTPNVPQNAELADASFGRHQALTTLLALHYQPGQKYISRPDRKINLGSRWPSFSVAYRKGFKNLLGSDVDYHLVALSADHELPLGLLGTSRYTAIYGHFLRDRQMTILDFRHFPANRTLMAGDFYGFQLLDYYRYSTREQYVQLHYAHHFNGFILNKVPLLRRLRWQEVASVNYLRTPASRQYLELGVGVEHIFKILRVDVYSGFQEKERVTTGVRVGFGF